jgi:hypothetical protein
MRMKFWDRVKYERNGHRIRTSGLLHRGQAECAISVASDRSAAAEGEHILSAVTHAPGAQLEHAADRRLLMGDGLTHGAERRRAVAGAAGRPLRVDLDRPVRREVGALFGVEQCVALLAAEEGGGESAAGPQQAFQLPQPGELALERDVGEDGVGVDDIEGRRGQAGNRRQRAVVMVFDLREIRPTPGWCRELWHKETGGARLYQNCS